MAGGRHCANACREIRADRGRSSGRGDALARTLGGRICYAEVMENPGFWRLPALPFVEYRRARDSAACYAPHTHDALSLGAVDAGCSTFSCHGAGIPLRAGDVVLVPPGVVHACNPVESQVWAYQMLYLDAAWVARMVGCEILCEGRVLTHLPAATFTVPVYEAFCNLTSCLLGTAGILEKETRLVAFIADILLPLQRASLAEPLPTVPDGVALARAAIEQRCGETLRLTELAQIAGLSPCHFVRAFRARIGMTPHAWQLDARIRRARRLLDAGVPLAELALQLGFADQSHFQRVFRQRVAVTPRQYRRNFIQD